MAKRGSKSIANLHSLLKRLDVEQKKGPFPNGAEVVIVPLGLAGKVGGMRSDGRYLVFDEVGGQKWWTSKELLREEDVPEDYETITDLRTARRKVSY